MNQDKIIVHIDRDLEDLIPVFLDNRVKDIENLKSAVTVNDYDKLRSIGHNLKGVGGGYGFAMITDLGADIEAAAKVNDIKTINELINSLADYLERVEIVYQ
ncbi:MAG: Hpt domain-containing protein [Gammaproteobacteria bacterium]|nr:Hpt domain-containing protein [Gammaproteobacteria bacterium]